MPILREPSTNLPPGYRLEHDADTLILRRSSDGSFVGAFSVRGVSEQAFLQTIEDDRSGRPLYSGPQEHAVSVRRMVQARMGSSWESFLRTERRLIEARKNGQLAKALGWRLPGEAQEQLDGVTSEDQRRAEDGLVKLRSEKGELSYKQIEQLSPEDRTDRIRAELVRIEWLIVRQRRRNIILRSSLLGPHKSRKSLGQDEVSKTSLWEQASWRNRAS
jgi:hypothetical protein